jgi:hypothetical protein
MQMQSSGKQQHMSLMYLLRGVVSHEFSSDSSVDYTARVMPSSCASASFPRQVLAARSYVPGGSMAFVHVRTSRPNTCVVTSY